MSTLNVVILGELAGGPVKQSEIRSAAKKVGISEATLRRAKLQLGVKSEKAGMGTNGYWAWRLPNLFEHSKVAHTTNMSGFKDPDPPPDPSNNCDRTASAQHGEEAHMPPPQERLSTLEVDWL